MSGGEVRVEVRQTEAARGGHAKNHYHRHLHHLYHLLLDGSLSIAVASLGSANPQNTGRQEKRGERETEVPRVEQIRAQSRGDFFTVAHIPAQSCGLFVEQIRLKP